MALPVQQFRVSTPDEANPMGALMKSLMSGYGQGLQAKQMQQNMQVQREQQEMQQKAIQDQAQKQKAYQSQIGEIMGHPAQASQGVPYGDIPGTGLLGGQISQDDAKQQLANVLAMQGDLKSATSLMYPRQQDQTAMMKNLQASGLKPGTPEYQKAATSLLEKGLLPTNIKQARYAGGITQNIIDRINDEGTIDSVKKFAGFGGKGKEIASGIAGSLGLYNDPDYLKYRTFTTQTVPTLAAETRKLFGDNASVEITKKLEEFSNPNSWTGSPELIESRWNEFMKLHDEALDVSKKSPLEMTSESKSVPRGTSSEQTEFSTDDYMAEAKRRGLI